MLHRPNVFPLARFRHRQRESPTWVPRTHGSGPDRLLRGGHIIAVTLITGTSSGIGRATTLYLARQGYHVFASMRHPETEATALTEVANQEHLPLADPAVDVSYPASSPRAVQEVRRFHIRVVIIEPGVIDTPAFAKPRRKLDPELPPCRSHA